ncbi:hypothetical protein [Streptomyces boncukensis]|uniref:Uncharacterized protein n=1 Tax=Streptomyces boncukensis TaxID=2711219 RepID=A0A6G4X242_9ACTN|nr:hypothetical protein [Streptomyces boncukensis]NGO71323.1 hypothetical protein [Streptomyces boncukensis]
MDDDVFPQLPPPRPVDGCSVCRRYARSLALAERTRDASSAVDIRVLWRAHHAREHAGAPS